MDAMLNEWPPLEVKNDGEDAAEDTAVEKALEAFTTSANSRIEAAETKAADALKRAEAAELAAKRRGAAPADDGEKPEVKAFATYLRRGEGAPDEELKTLTGSNDTQGGYLAPEETSAEFIRNLVEVSPVRTVASVRSIGGPSIKYPKRTSVTNAQWTGEAQDAPESTVAFGQVEIAAHELTTFVDISNQLLADSGGTAEAEVRLALAEDFGRKEGLAFVSGTGAGQPEGILTNADIADHVNGHATNLSAEALIAMMYSLPAMYRNNGAWAMNGTTLGKLRTLKDGDGRFLWQPSFQVGQPETILGRPVVELPDMPDAASATTPIVFGDWSAYRVVDRIAMSIFVNPFLLATKGVTRVHATRRVGGSVLQAARFKKLKMVTS